MWARVRARVSEGQVGTVRGSGGDGARCDHRLSSESRALRDDDDDALRRGDTG